MEKKREIRIKSSIQNEVIIHDFIEQVCDYYNIYNTYFGNIIIAVNEAVNNAIIHGNENNPDKDVTVLFDSSNGLLCFEITDQGAGFDYNNLPDPIETENEKRGLFLISALADNISFKNQGSTIKLEFVISGIDKELHKHRENHLLQYQKSEEKEKNTTK